MEEQLVCVASSPGTVTGYRREGCRCEDCREAHRAQQEKWRRAAGGSNNNGGSGNGKATVSGVVNVGISEDGGGISYGEEWEKVLGSYHLEASDEKGHGRKAKYLQFPVKVKARIQALMNRDDTRYKDEPGTIRDLVYIGLAIREKQFQGEISEDMQRELAISRSRNILKHRDELRAELKNYQEKLREAQGEGEFDTVALVIEEVQEIAPRVGDSAIRREFERLVEDYERAE